MAHRVIVVDDDTEIRRLIADELTRSGEFVVLEAGDSEIALQLAETNPQALVVLDIGLPDRSGLDVLREFRRTGDRPIIILTGLASETDRVIGLELGADDYIVKPCFPREVLARVRTVLRRTSPSDFDRGVAVLGQLSVDPAQRQVWVAGRNVDLTAREFDLLNHFASQPGQAFAREDLMRDVWGSEPDWQSTATITEHVYRLRAKLRIRRGEPGWIATVRSIGYRMET